MKDAQDIACDSWPILRGCQHVGREAFVTGAASKLAGSASLHARPGHQNESPVQWLDDAESAGMICCRDPATLGWRDGRRSSQSLSE